MTAKKSSMGRTASINKRVKYCKNVQVETRWSYGRFATELNRALHWKEEVGEFQLSSDLNPVWLELTRQGLIRGFYPMSANRVKLFFRFEARLGKNLINSIELLTKTSARNYKDTRDIKKMVFHTKSSFPQYFIKSMPSGFALSSANKRNQPGGEIYFRIK